MNIRNENANLNISQRSILEKELATKTVSWLKEYIEKSNKDLNLLNTRLPLKYIMFYYAFANKIINKEYNKTKELVEEFKSFYDNCDTYELVYYYLTSVDNVMCIQFELNENLIIEGTNLAYDDLFVNTIMANLSLVGLIFKHNLLENEIKYFSYDKTINDIVPVMERSQAHLLHTRFYLPLVITQDSLDESAKETSEKHVVESIVELNIKYKQELYLKLVYGKVYPSLFSSKPYVDEKEVFLPDTVFNYRRKNIPLNGAYIIPESHETIHSIFIKESVLEIINSIDCCIRYKDDTSSNMCIFIWRDGYNIIQGREPADVLKFIHTYLGTFDYGIKFRVIEE